MHQYAEEVLQAMKVIKMVVLFTITISSLIMMVSVSYAEQQSGTSREKAKVKRGLYLVVTSGCNDCHTPKMITQKGPVPDPDRHYQTILPLSNYRLSPRALLLRINGVGCSTTI